MNVQQQQDIQNALALLSKVAMSAVQPRPEPVSTGSSSDRFNQMLADRRKSLLKK